MSTEKKPSRAQLRAVESRAELDWQADFMLTEKGKRQNNAANIDLVLRNDPAWNGVLRENVLSGTVEKAQTPPYAGARLGEWSDTDDTETAIWLSRNYGISPPSRNVLEVVNVVARKNAYNPVKDYLDGLVWDGIPRLKGMLAQYFGVADTRYAALVGELWMTAAVVRIYRPGAKVDNVLILEGVQGLRKSSALKALAGEWFMDTPIKIGHKETYEVMRGMWIVELAELDALNRTEASAAKAFFSSSEDRYRESYGRRAQTIKRMCVFAGTVNHRQYLRDSTENRRYWPVWCERLEMESLKADRDQLWAEAVARFKAGEPWWPEADDVQLFREEQEKRYIGDAYEDKIVGWLENQVLLHGVSTSQIMGGALGLDTAKWTVAEQTRVGNIMSRLGWEKRRITSQNRRIWAYFPPTDWQAPADQGVEI